MRTIETTTRFRRDYRREKRGQYRKVVDAEIRAVLDFLAGDLPLPARYRDHALAGAWSDHRDCHLKPDLVLLYRKPNETTLQMVRLGSHSELELA